LSQKMVGTGLKIPSGARCHLSDPAKDAHII